MKQLRSYFFILVLLFLAQTIHGQGFNLAGGKVKMIPLPVIASNPSTGVMFGVAPAFNWTMGSKENTSMSAGLVSAVYSTNKQIFISGRGNTFLAGDRWNLYTDIRYFITSQPTYGLGTGSGYTNSPLHSGSVRLSDDPYSRIPVSQMLEFTLLKIHQTVLRRYEDSRFFYGLGYHLDMFWDIDDNLLDLTPPSGQQPFITHHYQYNTKMGFNPEKYAVSGISVNATYDSRDNITNPYSGRYLNMSFKVNPVFLGSSKTSGLLWLEYRDYFPFSKQRPRHQVALWAYGNFLTFGKVPYMVLPFLGSDMFGRSGRPYTQGRYRGEDLVYSEVEYRFPILKNSDLLGGVIFVNGVTASSRTQNIDILSHFNFGYGAGLRVLLDKTNRMNLTLDYGFGDNGMQGFFLAVSEVF